MSSSDNSKAYLTSNQVAELLMISPATVRLWASKGLLDAQTTIGGHRRFLLEDVARFARERGIAIALPEPEQRGLKLLIVDDDQQLRGFLVELLIDHPGVDQIETAENGFVAGQKIEQFQPNVVLLDLMMPGMDGFEVCQYLKSVEVGRKIRVIAMTGYHSKENQQRILEAGAEACLPKPLDRKAVMDALGLSG